MTLDEAIKHAEEVAEEKEGEAQDLEYSKLDWRHEANQCSKCAEEHRQLAGWLKDYKRLLEQEPKTGHCEDCKHFRKIPYHADACIQHTGLCPKGDWYCADFEPQEISSHNLKMWEDIYEEEKRRKGSDKE